MPQRHSAPRWPAVVVAFAGLAAATAAASCASQTSSGPPEVIIINEGPDGSVGDATTDRGANQDTWTAPTESGTDAGADVSCDADTMNDPFNCGGCGNQCMATQSCSCGNCLDPCPAGKSPCCGTCVDLGTDPSNCGACGQVCPQPLGSDLPAVPTCVGGGCTFICLDDAGVPVDAGAAGDASAEGGLGGIVACSGEGGTPAGCFDPSTSPSACGGCGNVCTNGGSCYQGTCCAAGSMLCGTKCVNVWTDSQHCGSCTNMCGQGTVCWGGQCVGYTVSNPTETFLDACAMPGHTSVLLNQPYWAYTPVARALPFTFRYFSDNETQFWIGSQGVLGFGVPSFSDPPSGAPPCLSGQSSNSTGYPGIVAFGDPSLGTGHLGVCFAETDFSDAGVSDAGNPDSAIADAGNDAAGDAGTAADQFVVTWWGATQSNDPGSMLTFSIVLTQGSNVIDLQYETARGSADGGITPIVAGSQAGVGAQLTVAEYAVYSCNRAFIPHVPYDVRLTPAP
jgi:hypothetical protein